LTCVNAPNEKGPTSGPSERKMDITLNEHLALIASHTRKLAALYTRIRDTVARLSVLAQQLP